MVFRAMCLNAFQLRGPALLLNLLGIVKKMNYCEERSVLVLVNICV